MTTTAFTVSATFCQPNEGHVTLTGVGDLTGTLTGNTSDLNIVPSSEEAKRAALTLLQYHVRNLSGQNKKAAGSAGVSFSITSTP